MTTLRRHEPAYRVLVELAGQDRPMTLRELFEATGLTPDVLHAETSRLVLSHYLIPRFERDDRGFFQEAFTITWEGQEALRRCDTEATLRMRRADLPQPTAKKRWWRR